jgi:hypothetical protein
MKATIQNLGVVTLGTTSTYKPPVFKPVGPARRIVPATKPTPKPVATPLPVKPVALTPAPPSTTSTTTTIPAAVASLGGWLGDLVNAIPLWGWIAVGVGGWFLLSGSSHPAPRGRR